MDNSEPSYWEEKYKNQQTAWDIGEISSPLKAYIDQLEDKSIKILIPGAGNSYEAEYLFLNGFKNVYVADFAASPLQNIKNRIPNFPESQLLHTNFFKIEDQYDLILEQTFFCALPKSSRCAYAEKMQQLLQPKGKLVGLLFDDELLGENPPFGGSKKEYLSYFEPLFNILTFKTAHNSIPPRKNREFFIQLQAKEIATKYFIGLY